MEDGLQLSGMHNAKRQYFKVLALVAVCWLLFVGKGELLIDGNISALPVYLLCKELCMTQAEMLPSISNSLCMHNDGGPNLTQVTDKKWLFDKCALIYLVSVPNKICW